MVFLSNLMPSKGASDFVDVAIKLSSRFPDVEFIVAGAETDNHYTQSLRQRVVIAKKTKEIHFVGGIYNDEKWKLLQSATLLAYPSKVDAQPLTIIEAFFCGIPVVAYSVGGIPDLIVNDVNGYLVEANDVQAFTDRCAEILEDSCLKARLGLAARESFDLRYSEKAYERNWLALIQELNRNTD